MKVFTRFLYNNLAIFSYQPKAEYQAILLEASISNNFDEENNE